MIDQLTLQFLSLVNHRIISLLVGYPLQWHKSHAIATANNQTGLSWARTNTHSYYVQETQTNQTNNKTITVNRIDAGTYANTSIATQTLTTPSGSTITIETNKYLMTYYEYEVEQNDEKRIIKILKPEYAPLVEQEFRQVFK